MLKAGLKSFLVLMAGFIIYTCIDPYAPKLKGYGSNLVVDGLITDANTSYSVKLSRTILNQNDTPLAVSDATVFITDDNGNSSSLVSKGNGVYKTDSIEFKGIPGRTYVLHIVTGDGNEYKSDPCLMQSVPDIDSIYYDKDQQVVNNGTQNQVGLSIYLDSKEGDNNSYYRWDYDETWEFKVPYPKKWDYINEKTVLPVAQIKEFCWKNVKSYDVLIHAVYPGQPAKIVKQPINFIVTDKSDRLMINYSIVVRQYSLSKNEYNFWDNLNKVNLSGSDIFASQPFPVISNIHNINNPGEKVPGYFQVSAVKEKRIFIPFSEIVRLQLPFYHNPCKRIEQSHNFVPTEWLTWDEIYSIYCITSDYTFVEAIFTPDSLPIYRMIFTRPECADCELTGTLRRPDFWIDLN
jgi:hypothetical protein